MTSSLPTSAPVNQLRLARKKKRGTTTVPSRTRSALQEAVVAASIRLRPRSVFMPAGPDTMVSHTDRAWMLSMSGVMAEVPPKTQPLSCTMAATW